MTQPDFVVTEWTAVPTARGELRAWQGRPFKDTHNPPPFLDLAYQVRPQADARFPALAVVFEVYGLADHIQGVCHRLAKQGYLAVAPDLYGLDPAWREIDTWDVERARAAYRSADPEVAKGIIATLPAGQQPGALKALDWLISHDTSSYLSTLGATIDYLKARPDVDPDRVGIIGFCMGGGLAGQLASQRADLAATVIYYGAPPRSEAVPNLTCPVMAHYGSLDDLSRRAPEFQRAMQEHGKQLNLHIYEGMPHRFFNDTRPFYQQPAADFSWQRTLAFLAQHLGGSE